MAGEGAIGLSAYRRPAARRSGKRVDVTAAEVELLERRLLLTGDAGRPPEMTQLVEGWRAALEQTAGDLEAEAQSAVMSKSQAFIGQTATAAATDLSGIFAGLQAPPINPPPFTPALFLQDFSALAGSAASAAAGIDDPFLTISGPTGELGIGGTGNWTFDGDIDGIWDPQGFEATYSGPGRYIRANQNGVRYASFDHWVQTAHGGYQNYGFTYDKNPNNAPPTLRLNFSERFVDPVANVTTTIGGELLRSPYGPDSIIADATIDTPTTSMSVHATASGGVITGGRFQGEIADPSQNISAWTFGELQNGIVNLEAGFRGGFGPNLYAQGQVRRVNGRSGGTATVGYFRQEGFIRASRTQFEGQGYTQVQAGFLNPQTGSMTFMGHAEGLGIPTTHDEAVGPFDLSNPDSALNAAAVDFVFADSEEFRAGVIWYGNFQLNKNHSVIPYGAGFYAGTGDYIGLQFSIGSPLGSGFNSPE